MTVEEKAKMQYTFDVIAAHLLTQNKRSTGKIEGNTFCLYKDGDGNRCAVGFCISEENYRPELEGLPVDSPSVQEAIGEQYSKNEELLICLQHIHDCSPESEWPAELRAAAIDLELESSIVDTFATVTIPQPQELSYV